MNILFSHRQEGLFVHHTYDETPCAEHFSIHAHDMNELYYFIDGKGSFFVEGNEYQLSPGCVLIMRSGETHQLRIDSSIPYERIAIHFSSYILNSFDAASLLSAFNHRRLGEYNFYSYGELNQALLTPCFNTFTNNFYKNLDDCSYKLYIISHLLPILIELNKGFHLNKDNIPSHSDKLIGEIIKFINQNLSSSNWNLDTLSDKFFISKSHMNNKFKKATGSTIWEYTIIKRLLKSREEIKNGLPVMQVFASSGFTDYSSFYRRYKLKFGTAPISDRPAK